MKPWITLHAVEKTIEDFHIGPLTIDFEPGTITALIGTNGSGKSTFCKMLMNLVKQTKGEILVRGSSTYEDGHTWKHHIAYQPQKPIGYDVYTGNDLQELVSPWYPTWNDERFNTVVQELNIPMHKKYGKMSEGAQQKLLFALTIAKNADILLLDEPTAHMDIPSKRYVIDTLVEWMDEKERMIIISSHQMDDIRKLSDYLCVLHGGNIVGNFEKEALHDSFKQYWFAEELPNEEIPGEHMRQQRMLVSDNAIETEDYLQSRGIQWEQESHVELEEIITHLLSTKQK